MKYRREIDGLRALAVIPVIFFHAGFSLFSGGFVGVDIFFVISGYLITSILINEIISGDFSIITFYERRARRILPALFLVMLVSVPFAWFWLIPADMLDFAQSYSAISVFSSNLLFWKESGYFDVATELKPMLHTWSLAVEEQFYVILPLLLIVLWRFGLNACVTVLTVFAVASLLLAHWASSNDPSAAFYLLPFRWWELAFGSLTAFFMYRSTGSGLGLNFRQLLCYLGVVLIAISLFSFDKHTPFPSFYTLLPVVGTCLIILFCTSDTHIGKVLGSRLLVAIGLVSYSAYLWHQPVFALLKQRFDGELNAFHALSLVLLTFTLAYISWRFVERPFRNKQRIGRAAIFSMALLGSALIMLFGVAGHLTNGYSARYDNVLDGKITSFPRIDNGWCFYSVDTLSSLEVGEKGQHCLLGQKGADKKALLFGDSFAGQYEPFWHKVADSLGIEVNSVTTNWCFPSSGDGFSGPKSSSAYQQCLMNRAFLQQHVKDYDLVVLGGDWATVFNENDLDGTKELIKWLASEVKLVVIMPSPKRYDKNVNALYVRSVFLDQPFDISTVAITADESAVQAHQQLEQLAGKFSNVVMISRHQLFKGDTTSEKIPYSADGGHISIYGAEAAAELFLSGHGMQELVGRMK